MLRLHLLILLLIASTVALAQEKTGVWGEAFQQSSDAADRASGRVPAQGVRPDIIVQVKKHRMGADMFDIMAVDADYPPELLRSQVEKLCSILQVPARGLNVGHQKMAGADNITSTRALFATNGVIDTESGTLRIEPIVKAFAGAPEPHVVHGITILFNGLEAQPQMLRSLNTAGLRLQAVANVDPPVLEYHIQLLSQNPDDLDIPDAAQPEQNPPPSASSVQQKGVDWTLWLSLLAGAVAAGILVYFLMLRASAKPGR